MIPKEKIISVGIISIMVLGAVSIFVPEKADGIADAALSMGGSGSGNYTPIQPAIADAGEGDIEPVNGAGIDLDWTDDIHSKGNYTFSDATGYYEMNVAEGTANITAGHSHTYGAETLYVWNFSGKFTIDSPPYTYWKNITLPTFPQNKASIVGHVYDNNTNNPLKADINIFFTGSYFDGNNVTSCTIDGSYNIHLPPAEVTVTASAPGYYLAYNLTTIGEETKTLNFYLEPEPPEIAVVKGYITDSDSETGIDGADLMISGLNLSYFNSTFADATGYYKCNLPAGNFSVIASADDYFSKFMIFEINASEVKWFNVSLVPYPPESAWVEGHIYDDSTGLPLAGAELDVSGSITIDMFNFGSFSRNTTTNAAGYYNVSVPAIVAEELFPGYYSNVVEIDTISASANGYFYNSSSGDVIEPGDVMVRNIALEPEPPEICIVKGYIYQGGAPPANQPPTCSLSVSPSSGTAPLTVKFDMGATDSDGTITSWALDINNDGTPDYSGSGGPPMTRQHIYSTNGVYIAKLTVTDNNGSTGTDTVTVTVLVPGNQSPTCALSVNPTNGPAPLTVIFTMTASDPDGSISSWTLDIDNDGTIDYVGLGSPPSTMQHIYTNSGVYTAKLTVTDNNGSTGTDTVTVTVSVPINQPPTCALSVNPTRGIVPLTVTFTLSANDPDGSITTWTLDINNDGTPEYSGSGTPPSTKQHIYQTAGTYTANFTVTDNQGATGSNIGDSIIVSSEDDIPPITTIIVNPPLPNGENNWYISNVTVTLTGTDEHSELNATYYKIDDGSWLTYTSPFVLSSNGEHAIRFYSTDTLGNTEDEKSFSVQIDKAPPETVCSLTPSSPNGNNGWYTEAVKVMLSASDGGVSGINGTWYRLDGGAWQRYMGLVTLQDAGNHTLDYYSTDIAGNDGNPKSVRIKIDATKPSVSLNKPKEKTLYVFDRELIRLPFGTLIIGKITLEAQASDAVSGIAKVEFFVDGELRYSDTIQPHEWVYDERALLFHRHTLKLKIYDVAGNIDETDELDIWVFNI